MLFLDLMMSCKEGESEEMKELIQQGVDIQYSNESGSTVFHEASWYGRSDIMEYLCEYLLEKEGEDFVMNLLERKNNEGRTALHNASIQCQLSVLECVCEFVLDHGGEEKTLEMMNLKDSKGKTIFDVCGTRKFVSKQDKENTVEYLNDFIEKLNQEEGNDEEEGNLKSS